MMQTMQQAPSPRRLTAAIVAISVLGAAWILLLTPNGPRLHGDGAAYQSLAENLAAGKGLISFWGSEIVAPQWHISTSGWFPPGYPIVLAGFELVGLGAAEGGRWLNAALFGATIAISGLWLKTLCRSTPIVLAGTLAIACSPKLQGTAANLHSDPLYLLLTIGCLILVSEFLKQTDRDRRSWCLLATAGLLAGLSVAVRYVGVVAIASSLVLLLWWNSSRSSLRARLRAATVFGLAAALSVAVVLARNIAETGSIFAGRLDRSTGHTLLDAVEISVLLQFRPSIGIGWIMLAGAALICWAARRQPGPQTPPRQQARIVRGPACGLERSAPFAAFTALYIATVVFTQPWNQGPVNARLWLPAAIGLVFVGCEALDAALHRRRTQTAGDSPLLRVVTAGTITAVVVALTAASYLSVRNTRHARSLDHADAYVVGDSIDSPVLAYLEHQATDGAYLFSNRPVGIYILTGIQPVQLLPRRPAGQTWTDSECLDRLSEISAAAVGSGRKEIRIAWFKEPTQDDPSWYCDIGALASSSAELVLVQDFPDGSIYRLEPSS